MRVLIGCEFSGVVRDAFIARGHDAWSCDLLPTTAPGPQPTQRFNGRIVIDPAGRAVERWSNQTDSGQNALPPSDDRWAERSVTFQGIANAMADQWSVLSPIVEQMTLFT